MSTAQNARLACEAQRIKGYKVGDPVRISPQSIWFTDTLHPSNGGAPVTVDPSNTAHVVLVGYKWLTVSYNGRKIRLYPHDIHPS
jgi:hypothetical protein